MPCEFWGPVSQVARRQEDDGRVVRGLSCNHWTPQDRAHWVQATPDVNKGRKEEHLGGSFLILDGAVTAPGKVSIL